MDGEYGVYGGDGMDDEAGMDEEVGVNGENGMDDEIIGGSTSAGRCVKCLYFP